jgi:hypothetical protein
MAAISPSPQVNRRQFLVSGVLMGVCALIPQAKGAPLPGVEQIFRECADRAPDLVRWLEHAIPDAEQRRLTSALSRSAASPDFPRDAAHQRALLQHWIRDDFLAGRTLNAAGVEVTRTEAAMVLIGNKIA